MLALLATALVGATDGGITTFSSPKDAFAYVLAMRPQILGVGEYHELKGAPKVPSAIKHFTNDALPILDGGATSLVVETWMLNGRCGHAGFPADQPLARGPIACLR